VRARVLPNSTARESDASCFHCCRATVDDLLDFWTFSERHLFSRLNETFANALKTASSSVIRLWIVDVVKRSGAGSDGARMALDGLFTKHGEKLRAESGPAASPDLDWTPWFALPFCKVCCAAFGCFRTLLT
jgi:hypothetical protein